MYKVSLDFSTLCRKRILQQTIIAELQAALEKPLTREEGIAIRDALMALQEEGRKIEVACALCYVESARMKSPEQIKKFLNNRENVLRDFFASKSGGDIKGKIKQAELDMRAKLGVELDASLKSLDKKTADAIRQAKRDAKASYAPTKAEQELIEVAKAMTVSDFTSPEGLENLAKNYPELFDAYTSYVRNATKSKGIENDTWWRAGDSSRIGDVLIANMNRENGLRSQSWSDFQVIHILDYIAATIELSTRNAKEQAYTKVPDYVELMGQTGVMINMSLIPTSKFDGTLQYDEVEGIAYKRALELREKYPATAGTICIGVDNKQIQMLLADINIDYVIPYHRSGMAAAIRKLMHIPTWSEYEKYQGETELSDADAKKNAEKYGVKLLDKSDPNYQKHTNFSEWFDLEVAKQIAKMENANPSDKAKQKAYGVMYGGYMAMQDAANNYLKLCAERGLSPKFSHEKADFTVEDNYWKLLIDRKMVNNATGEIIEQQIIQPIFDEGEVLRILNDELERYPSVKADQDYAVRKVTENFLSGNIKSGMSAEAIAKVMKKPVDNVTNVNIEAAVEEVEVREKPDVKYSFRNSKSGTANDALSPYGEELAHFIKQKGDYIVDSFKKLKQVVDLAFDNPTAKATAYFGIINQDTLAKIKNSISNLPKTSQEILFKTGRDYSIATTLDSIRHIVDDKNLSRDDVVNYLDRLADTIVEFDSVAFDYYTDSYKNKIPGIIFKKKFEDGTLVSFDLISQKKKSLVLQTIYLNSGDYQKKKSAETLLMRDRLSRTPEVGVGQTSVDSVPQEEETVKVKNSDRNSNGDKLSEGQQEYFKDSKVRDADGNLRVVYHGTPNGTFTEFKMTEGSHSSLMAQYGAGFYFDTDRNSAKRYTSAVNKTGGVSNPKVYEAYLNITNPLEITDTSHVVTKDQLAEVVRRGNYEWFFTNGIPNELRNYLGKTKAEIQQMPREEIVNHWVDMVYERAYNDSDILSNMVKAFKGRTVIEAMKEVFGKDGIHVTDRYGEMWIAWDANQIKETNNLNPTSNPDIRYSERSTDSNRDLLANALETTVQNDLEAQKLKLYKEKISLIDAEQQKLAEINAEIRELSFAKGKRDTERLKALRFEAAQTANRINTYDRQLLNLESTKVLKAVLNREKGLAMKRQKQKNAEVQKAYREKITETRDKQEAVKKLQKVVLDTSKWISYPKKEDVKCPDILRGPYAEFLESIDLSSKRLLKGGEATLNDQKIANAMNSLATAIEQIKAAQNPTADTKDISPEALDAGYLDLPVNFVVNLRKKAEDITKLMVPGNFVVDRMSSQDVKQISKLIKILNHSIKEMSTMYSNLRFAHVEEAGVHTIDFLGDIGETKSTNAIADYVSWENGLPYFVFKRFGEAGESIFEELMDAQDKLAFLADEIFKFKDKTWTDKEANAWGKDTHTIELPSGNEITLTTADAMGIYCLSRREQAVPHLLGGGIRVIGATKGAKKASDSRSTLTVEDLNTIISSLSGRQKSVAEAIQEFMSGTCSEWGNEISMKRFLTKEFREKNYYPIESSDENLPVKDKMAQQADLYRLLNISATKPLTEGANNAVVIRNIFEVFTNHTSDMAKLNAYGMALLDYMKWVNYREKTTSEEGQITTRGVRQSMNSTYGDKAFSYVLNLIKDVNGRYNDGGDHAWLMKMTRTAKTAAVGNSLRVAALQVTSYPRAGYVLSQKSLALGLTKKPQIKKAQKYCGIALWKSFGFYDTNISRSMEDQIKGTTDIKQKLIEWSLKGAELGDALTWGVLWNACEYEVASTKEYKVGTEEFNQAVGKKLREVVYATQVVDSTLTRSQIMRNKSGLTQGATAFMSEPTLSANIIMDAAYQFNLEKRRTGKVASAWKKTGNQIGRAVAIYSLGQLTAATIEALFDAYRDDDDEEFKKKFAEAFEKNVIIDLMPFNKIPIISDIAEFLMSRFDIGYFSSDNLSTTWLSQAANAYDAWAEIIEERRGGKETSKTVYNAIYNTTRAISSMTGVAGSGLMREAVVLWNNTAGAYDSTLKVKTYENSKTQNGQLLYEAMVKGDKRQAESLKAQFESEDEVSKTLVKALRENDPRIKEAAEARLGGDMTEYLRIAKSIKAEGNFHQDIIVAAINGEMNALKKDDEASSGFTSEPIFTNADYYNAAVNGDAADVKAVKDYLVESGKTEAQIQSSFNSSVKDAYEQGEITAMSAVSLMTTYGGKTSDEANLSVKYMDFKTEYPEYADSITETKFSNYYEPISDYGGYSLEDWGISLGTYAEYCVQSAECKGVDANGDGKTDSGSKKAEVLVVINTLPLTYEQKDALYYLNGWSAKTIYEAPWH